MPPEKRKWYTAASQGEDISLTPAERAEKKATCTVASTKLDDEFDRFCAADVEEQELGADSSSQEVVILGAGLVGALCAVVLLRKGFKVHLFERYTDIRSIPALGRSINLSVTSRGLRAVKGLGGSLYDDLLKLATRIRGRIIHTSDGQTCFQRYGRDDTECNYSISRYELNRFLIEAADREGASLKFDHSLSETSDFGMPDAGCTLHFTRGSPSKPSEQTLLRLKVRCPIIACDGAGSRVRYALRHLGLTTFTEDLLTRGYKEVLFPKPAEGAEFGAKGGAGNEACDGRYGLHIWPRGDHMLMALSNLDGSFTGTIYMDHKGSENSFEALAADRDVCEAFCMKYYKDAADHIGGLQTFVKQLMENPPGVLGTVWTDHWAIGSKVLLIGDAAHAMVPFFGQGCNCGFEDVLWLSRLLDKYCGDGMGKCLQSRCTEEAFRECFKELEAKRKPDATAICSLALENFVEMRDKTGDRKFQAMKKVENKLENVFGHKFRSRYAMVCYGGDGNVSYSNALLLGKVQAEILETLCEHMNTTPDRTGNIDTDEGMQAEVARVDMDLASKLIDDLLVPKITELSIDLSSVRH